MAALQLAKPLRGSTRYIRTTIVDAASTPNSATDISVGREELLRATARVRGTSPQGRIVQKLGESILCYRQLTNKLTDWKYRMESDSRGDTVPRYYFHIFDGASLPDESGKELHDVNHAGTAAIQYAAALLVKQGDRLWKGDDWHVSVSDCTGLLLLRIDILATVSPALPSFEPSNVPALLVEPPPILSIYDH